MSITPVFVYNGGGSGSGGDETFFSIENFQLMLGNTKNTLLLSRWIEFQI